MGQPQQPHVASTTGGGEPGPHVLPGQRLVDIARGGHQGGNSRRRRDASGLDLGHHATGAHTHPTDGSDLDTLQVRDRVIDASDPFTTVLGRLGVQGVDVREQQQRVRLDQVRHESGNAVVVTELDLVGRHGVVLIDDGQDTQVQQAFDLAVRVLVLRVPHEVLGGQQHLPHGDPVTREVFGVAGDQ